MSPRWNILIVQNGSDFTKNETGGPQKNAAHDGGRFFVNQKMMLISRVLFAGGGRVVPHEFPAFCTRSLDCFDLFAGIPAVKLVKKVQKTHDIEGSFLLPPLVTVQTSPGPAPSGRGQGKADILQDRFALNGILPRHRRGRIPEICEKRFGFQLVCTGYLNCYPR